MLRLSARLVAAIAAFAVLGLAQASAASFTTANVQRFIDSLSAANQIGQELENEDLLDTIEPQDMLIDGTFKPYTAAMGLLKKEKPSALSQIASVAKANGFSGADEWAAMGDRVAMAFMALQAGALPAMPQMDASMMAMMPPHVQEQFKVAQAMMAAIKAVPQSDRDVVAPLVPALEAAMDLPQPGMGN